MKKGEVSNQDMEMGDIHWTRNSFSFFLNIDKEVAFVKVGSPLSSSSFQTIGDWYINDLSKIVLE